MELLKFDEIFNNEDVSNYDLFINKLKQQKEKAQRQVARDEQELEQGKIKE